MPTSGNEARTGGLESTQIPLISSWSSDLVNLNIAKVNEDIRLLFGLVYNAHVPKAMHRYFSDTYLFLLYKDLDDLTPLFPTGITSTMRRIIGTHVAGYFQK